MQLTSHPNEFAGNTGRIWNQIAWVPIQTISLPTKSPHSLKGGSWWGESFSTYKPYKAGFHNVCLRQISRF